MQVDPIREFREQVRRFWRGDIKGPFNIEDREKAGMSREFYEDLRGEMPYSDEERSEEREIDVGSIREALPQVRAEYES